MNYYAVSLESFNKSAFAHEQELLRIQEATTEEHKLVRIFTDFAEAKAYVQSSHDADGHAVIFTLNTNPLTMQKILMHK